MRSPPAVSIPIADDLVWRLAQAALAGLAMAALVVWARDRAWLPSIVFAAPLVFAAAALVWRIARQPASRLAWTAGQWLWCREGDDRVLADAPDVMLDLGPWMLVRLRFMAAEPDLWLTLRPGGDAPRWTAFRAAVYSFSARPHGRSSADMPRS